MNGRCIIHNVDVAEVFWNGKRLYKLVREIEEVNTVNKPLTLDMLYLQLGHILSDASQELVCDGLITGLKLEESGETDIFCELYVYNKIFQVPILKV